MSDTGVVLKKCRNRHSRGISFIMVYISTFQLLYHWTANYCDKQVNHCPCTVSSIWPSCFCKLKHTGDNGGDRDNGGDNGVDPLETSDDRVPKVNRDSRRFFANLDISLYIHLLVDFPRFELFTCF